MKNFLLDLYRRTGRTDCRSFLKELLVPQYRFVFIKRMCENTRKNKFRMFEFMFWRMLYGHYKIKYSIDIPARVKIGKGFRIGHIGGIVFNPDVVVGNNVDVYNGVLLGANFRGSRCGCPVIGDNVFIGTNAVVIGKISIGDNVLIAPNTLVNIDVPDNSIVSGNPASITHRQDATDSFIINRI